jgi:hypothetical protein
MYLVPLIGPEGKEAWIFHGPSFSIGIEALGLQARGAMLVGLLIIFQQNLCTFSTPKHSCLPAFLGLLVTTISMAS